EMAVVIVPETREFNELLEVIDAEVAKAIDGLSGDLDQRIEALRAGPEMLQSLNGSPELPQNNDRVLRLPEWLPRSEPTKEESTEARGTPAAARPPCHISGNPPRLIRRMASPRLEPGLVGSERSLHPYDAQSGVKVYVYV